MGKTSESLRHKAIGPVKWQPVANIKRHLAKQMLFVLLAGACSKEGEAYGRIRNSTGNGS